MNKKISTLIISILLLLLFVSVFFLFSSNSEKKYSYIVATSVSSNDTTSITENTTFLYIFENNKCVSTKINTKLDNDTNANEIKEVYNSIMEAEKSNNANIINYSEEKREISYEWTTKDISKSKELIIEDLSSNIDTIKFIEF